MTDRAPARDRLLALLSDHEPHSMAECLAVGGYRYGGRIHELRREGHRIVTVPRGTSEYEYRLLRDDEPMPGEEAKPESEQATLF